MRAHNCMLLFVSLMVSSLLLDGVSTAVVGARITGGWEPIKDVNNPQVQEIGEFAVKEHNKEAKEELKFERVISGETQVVAGVNYKLVVAAKDGASWGIYEAVVWEKGWLKFMALTSFTRV